MKLLSLNLWGGRQGKVLFDYLKEQAQSVDVFCFQEVFETKSEIKDYNGAHTNLLNELKESLPGFVCYYAPAYEGWVDMEKVDFHISEGQAIFVKEGQDVLENGLEYILGSSSTVIEEDFKNEPKIQQYLKLKEALIVNVHGMWHPGTKIDTKDRLDQSQKILKFVQTYKTPQIIIGDFNLYPETRSVGMFEDAGYRNLIKDFGIKSTRNEVSWNHFGNKQYFADYAFVTHDLEIKAFEVPYNEVSDHLPLLLDFGQK